MDCRRRTGCTGSHGAQGLHGLRAQGLHRGWDCTARRDYRGSRLRRGCKDYSPHTGYTGWPLHRGCTGRTVRRRLHMDYTGCTGPQGLQGLHAAARRGITQSDPAAGRPHMGCRRRRPQAPAQGLHCTELHAPHGPQPAARDCTGCRRRRDRRRPRTDCRGCTGLHRARRRPRTAKGCRDYRDRMVRRLPRTAGTDCTVRKGCTKRRGAPPGPDAAGSPPGFRRRMCRPRRGRRR